MAFPNDNVSSALGDEEKAAVSVSETVAVAPEEPPTPLPTRGKPFTLAEWNAMFDGDGRFQGSDKTVKQAIFSGGIDPDARAAVWPFLFGVHTFQSTSR